ncbi:MAG: hypothetical protein AUK27_05490 [Deltaproteobacteria bacterium CG2_30_66_27]|nr:MAG: hypothetical protein AUK27_05490 [Deltaproteobacteria bacterium CG2_30_66_27]
MAAMTSDGLDRFLSQLSQVKQTGDGEWIASCPAARHGQGRGDVHPSLSINRGNGSGALLHCHAGCRNEDILAAVGMGWPDLLPPKETTRRKSSSTIVATYDYTDDVGVLLYQAVRYEPKDFRQRRPDPDHPGKWIWNLKETSRVLYRLPDVKKAIAADERVYVVEGEKDADNSKKIGVTATCNVGGAGKWKPEYSDVLRGARVIVVPDADEPGRKHASQVFDALRGIAKDVKIVPLPGDGKDVSDWIAAGGTRDQLEKLAAGLNTEADPEPKLALFESIESLLANSTPQQWLIKGRLEIPSTVLCFGESTAGKSFVAVDMAANVASGGSWAGAKVSTEGAVFYIAEEGRRGIIRRNDGWQRDQGRTIPPGRLFISTSRIELSDVGGLTVEKEIERLAVANGNPKLVIVDTYSRALPPDAEENDAGDANAFLNVVDRLRDRFVCVVVIVHHCGLDKERARGSTALKAGVDAEFSVSKRNGVRVVRWTKTKDGEDSPPIEFALESVSLGQDLDGDEVSTAVVRWKSGTFQNVPQKTTQNEKMALETLRQAIEEANGLPVFVDAWRPIFYGKHTGDNDEAKRKAFKRVRDSLVKKELIRVDDAMYSVPADNCRDLISNLLSGGDLK